MKNTQVFQIMSKNMVSRILTLILVFIFFSLSADTIPENSIITGNWTIEGSPYVVMGPVTIPENDSLLIDPGVEVYLKSSTNYDPDTGDFNYNHLHVGTIWVMGQLKAIGTEMDSIQITRSTNAGNWGCIVFLPGTNSISEIAYCKIEFSYGIGDYPGGQNGYSGSLCNKNMLTIENSTFSNNGIGVYVQESETNISQSVFINNNLSIIGHYADLFVTGCEISNCQKGIRCDYGSGIISDSKITDCIEHGVNLYNTSFKVTGNLFRNNLWNGIHCHDDPMDTICYNIIEQSNSGIHCSGPSPVFYNNTIVNNNYFGFYLYYDANPIILNTILYDNPNDFNIAAPGINAVIAYSLTDSSSLPPEVADAGGNHFNIEPLFEDYQNGNFNLLEGSPCIDAGSAFFEWNNQTIIQLPSGSYNGNAPDIGALESPFTVSDFSDSREENDLLINCYPNPFNSHLSIITGDEKVYNVAILNSVWQKVLILDQVENNTSINLPFSHLPGGLYFLIAETSKEHVVRKLIKK